MEHIDPVERLTSMIHSEVFVKDLHYLIGDYSNKLTSMLRNFVAIWRNEAFAVGDPGESYKITKSGCLAFRKDGKTAYAMTTIEVTIGPVLSEEQYAQAVPKEKVEDLL